MQPVALTCLYVGALLLGAGTIGYWAWPSKHTTDPTPLRKAGTILLALALALALMDLA